MNRFRNTPLSLSALTCFADFLGGCLGAASGDDDVVTEGAASVAHQMPVSWLSSGSRPISSAAAGPHLAYYGGPVIADVEVYAVFWGGAAQVRYASALGAFYAGVTNSAYFDWLSEYDTTAQSIGRGSFVGSYDYASAPTGTVDDSQIRAQLAGLISAGTVPAPDADTLYAIHFAPGITVTEGGAQSCTYFCAYHGTFTRNGAYVFYSVIPDQGGPCAGGCGGDPSGFNNTTSVSSHELIEAVTDSAVGAAPNIAAPLAWYDSTYGEIGDICNAQQARILGGNGVTYVVQREFSNKLNGCVVAGAPGGSGGMQPRGPR
jgi:hypothetical protein